MDVIKSTEELIVEHLKNNGQKLSWLANKINLNVGHLHSVLKGVGGRKRSLTEDSLMAINQVLGQEFKKSGLKKSANNSKKMGYYKYPLYKVWVAMIARCYNKKAINWKFYGGSGVKVCDDWKNNFLSFNEWALSNGWAKGLQLDKDIIPNKLGIPALLYSPEYCSIVTKTENNRNRSITLKVTYKGETKFLAEWAEIYKIKITMLYNRIFIKKMLLEDAFNTPVRVLNTNIKVELNGEFKNIKEWCEIYNQPLTRVNGRLQKGWPLLKALTTAKSKSYNNEFRTKNVI